MFGNLNKSTIITVECRVYDKNKWQPWITIGYPVDKLAAKKIIKQKIQSYKKQRSTKERQFKIVKTQIEFSGSYKPK